jgi:hypothetical protein
MTEKSRYPTPAPGSMLAHVLDSWTYRVHHLKTFTPYFLAVDSGMKTFEMRHDDRGYQPGDLLVLWDWTGHEFTGRVTYRVVPYVMRDAPAFGMASGWVVMSLREVEYGDLADSNPSTQEP